MFVSAAPLHIKIPQRGLSLISTTPTGTVGREKLGIVTFLDYNIKIYHGGREVWVHNNVTTLRARALLRQNKAAI